MSFIFMNTSLYFNSDCKVGISKMELIMWMHVSAILCVYYKNGKIDIFYVKPQKMSICHCIILVCNKTYLQVLVIAKI